LKEIRLTELTERFTVIEPIFITRIADFEQQYEDRLYWAFISFFDNIDQNIDMIWEQRDRTVSEEEIIVSMLNSAYM
jgi:hypothetical protein